MSLMSYNGALDVLFEQRDTILATSPFIHVSYSHEKGVSELMVEARNGNFIPVLTVQYPEPDEVAPIAYITSEFLIEDMIYENFPLDAVQELLNLLYDRIAGRSCYRFITMAKKNLAIHSTEAEPCILMNFLYGFTSTGSKRHTAAYNCNWKVQFQFPYVTSKHEWDVFQRWRREHNVPLDRPQIHIGLRELTAMGLAPAQHKSFLCDPPRAWVWEDINSQTDSPVLSLEVLW